MNENYFIDTTKFTIDKFQNILKTKDILPGRIILKDKIDERFDLLKSKGIYTINDLLDTLKTKPKIERFSKDSGLSKDYLTILRREANSYISVPVNLTDLPFVETNIIHILESFGIKDSKQLFDIAAKKKDREILANRFKMPYEKLTELVQLSDLVRITGVGPVFARIIYESNIHSVREFLSFDPTDLFERLTKTNYEKGLTKAKFTIKDIRYCIDLGKDLPLIIEV
jgi:nucleotidyltransferase/DNA polymerase involved in DNA repair